LDYIAGAMQQSRLKKYLLKDEENADTSSFGDDPDMGFYTEYIKRRASETKEQKMPTLNDLMERVQKQSGVVFAQIAETFRKSILTSHLGELPRHSNGEKMDVRIIPDETDTELYHLMTLSRDSQQQGQLRKTVVTLRQNSGKGLKHSMKAELLQIPEVEAILDVQFVDDKAFLVLAETSSNVRIYLHDISQEFEGAWDVRHIFEQGQMSGGMRPARLEVNGRVGRRVVAVLDRDGLGYTVFDLESEDDAGQADGAGDSFMTG